MSGDNNIVRKSKFIASKKVPANKWQHQIQIVPENYYHHLRNARGPYSDKPSLRVEYFWIMIWTCYEQVY